MKVERHLLKDIMQSTKPWIEELMTADYKVIPNIFIMVTIIIIIDNIAVHCFALKLQYCDQTATT